MAWPTLAYVPSPRVVPVSFGSTPGGGGGGGSSPVMPVPVRGKDK